MNMNTAMNMSYLIYAKPVISYHKAADRHVLVLEANMPDEQKRKLFHLAELERKTSNELAGIMKNNYEQLVRTKKYRKLLNLYKKYSDIKDNAGRKNIVEQIESMQKQYNVTWTFCRTSMIPIAKKYNIDSVFGLTLAEDVWRGVQKCLYGNGNTLHFKKKGDLPSIRGKQINRGIIMKPNKNGSVFFKIKNIMFPVKIKDRFQQDEINAILKYLENPEYMDNEAVEAFIETGYLVNTYRPCYATIVCEEIRSKLRVYVHITIEGQAMPKYDRYNNPKCKLGTGNVGCDIGTQSFAYTSDTEVGLHNLAERGMSIPNSERKERLLYRYMDRSRRAMNPQNYNKDGTIKKGKKKWVKSNRYRKKQKQHKNLSRKNSINRHLAINEDINYLRSLGDTFVTEEKNASKLQKKAKATTYSKNGKPNRKKRFGKSIKNRCPGYFQAQAKRKFKHYVEVPKDYRASQYDHTADDYIKKKLSQRMFKLSDGTLVQRDWYSSFLLYCIDLYTNKLDKQKCKNLFNEKYIQEVDLIDFLKAFNIKIINSGIKAKAA